MYLYIYCCDQENYPSMNNTKIGIKIYDSYQKKVKKSLDERTHKNDDDKYFSEYQNVSIIFHVFSFRDFFTSSVRVKHFYSYFYIYCITIDMWKELELLISNDYDICCKCVWHIMKTFGLLILLIA